MTKKLLWPGEVGRGLGVSAATVRRLADAGAVEVLRDAKGRRHFRPEAINVLRKILGLEGVSEGECWHEAEVAVR
jgi:DNA-binding transcriptional MerR regulator